MKFKLPKIKKHFKKDSSEIRPDLYWKIILNSAFVLIALFCIFGYYNFIQINKDRAGSTEEENLKNPSVRNGRIEATLKYFEDRETRSEEILILPILVVDPSV